jgi:hypothetical protein
MTTPRQPWPTAAKEARDESAVAANEIIRLLNAVLRNETAEVDQHLALCIDRAHTICRLLERMGAPTLPPK